MKDAAKYILVDDAEEVRRIRAAIEKKRERFGEGYCPCVTPLAHSADTICPCLEYRNSGFCRCGLYKE